MVQGQYIAWLPGVAVGVAAIVSGFTSFALPETSKRPLFQSIVEMDEWTERRKKDKLGKDVYLQNDKCLEAKDTEIT